MDLSWRRPDPGVFEWSHWADKLSVDTLLLLLIVAWLKRERVKLEDLVYQLHTVRQQVAAVQEEVENPPEPISAAASAGCESWETVRSRWAEVRERIEAKIENLDGRVRRKFANMHRYNYAHIIKQLREDGELSEDVEKRLLKMNELFLKLRRSPHRTNPNIVNFFEQHFQVASAELSLSVDPVEYPSEGTIRKGARSEVPTSTGRSVFRQRERHASTPAI